MVPVSSMRAFGIVLRPSVPYIFVECCVCAYAQCIVMMPAARPVMLNAMVVIILLTKSVFLKYLCMSKPIRIVVSFGCA